MAIGTPNVLTQGADTTDGTAYTTASVAPAADRRLFLACLNGSSNNGPPSTVTGLGLTWTLLAASDNNFVAGSIWTATTSDTAPTPGAVTVTYPNTMNAAQWHIIEVEGTGTPGQVGIYPDGGEGQDQNPAWSLPAAPATGSAVIMLCGINSDSANITTGASYALLGTNQSTTSTNLRSSLQWADPAVQGAAFNTTAAAPRKIGIAIELPLAPVEPDPTAWTKVAGTRVPLTPISHTIRSVTPRAPEIEVTLTTSEDGSGTATLEWDITPYGNTIEGVYAGRDAPTGSGQVPWESSLTPGLTGSRVFENLTIGLTYTLHVDMVVGGQRVDRWAIEATPQDTTVDPDPGDLPNWTLLYSTEFEDLGGWNVRVETQSNDNSRNIAPNVVPASVAGGKGLTIYGKREGGYNRPYTSGEIDGSGSSALHVPTYFRAEIVGSHMFEDGLWPAVLWYRPIGTNDGEIDVHEFMGGRVENQQRLRYAVTMHNEYGSTQDSIKRPAYLDQLTNQSVTAVRTYVIEKTPNQITVTIDGELTRTFTSSDKAWWNRIMESGHAWYPRITLQIGDGGQNGGKTIVPEPPSGWTQSTMQIHSYRAWAYDPA